ncbi:MAG: hypothetical protein H0W50_10755 [Parachlamydiaceae bacterium]|nr:hypothetical protein [Parachlamydiaceae bacterium]
MTLSISRDMVSRLEISDHSYQSYPCEHNCKLILVDGRIATQELSGVKICVLLRFLAKDKIVYLEGTEHFAEFDNLIWLKWYLGSDPLPPPENILSSFIF